MAVKEALDLLSDKTAWLRWLREHVHYSADTAQNYMRVARFAEKTEALRFFSVWIRLFWGRKGRLTGDSKQDVLAAIERLRRTVLKWPAWATPAVAKARTAKR